MEPAVVVGTLLVAVALAAVVIGRWWALLIPLAVWPIYFLGVTRGWWLHGVGDGWEYGAMAIILFSLGLVALGVLLRAFVEEQRRRAVSS
jgi:hypothetical protein